MWRQIRRSKWVQHFERNRKELTFLNFNNAGFLNVTLNKAQQVGTTFWKDHKELQENIFNLEHQRLFESDAV